MKTAKQILSDITGYTVEELTERNTEPLLQAEDCLTAMYCFLAQMQANGAEQSASNCNIPFVMRSAFKEAYEKWYNTKDDAELGNWLFAKSKGITP